MEERLQHAPSYSRRLLLKGAAAAGTGALGLALFSGFSGTHDATAQSAHRHEDAGQAQHDALRKLWEDHIVWTRGFIVSFVASLPDLDATTQRLLRNQVDIGNAIKTFFGNAAGERLTALLTEHILGAARLLTAAKNGDGAGVADAKAAWYANADQIAAFLAGINPRVWQRADLQAMMHEHLDLTLAEAVAYLQGDWAGSIAAYDRVHDAILEMADMLADGISRHGRR